MPYGCARKLVNVVEETEAQPTLAEEISPYVPRNFPTPGTMAKQGVAGLTKITNCMISWVIMGTFTS